MARFARKKQLEEVAPTPVDVIVIDPIELDPSDPLYLHLQEVSRPVEIEKLDMDSPGLERMREAGIQLAVPLVTQGELVGVLNLGPRLSEREYSTDDRKLLDSLASQAAPAVRVAQLVREQEREAQKRERIAQELRVAALIQQTLLPKSLPEISGWLVEALYQPAREVGGDFYDFIELDDGKLGIVEGDVTDKGVPAALVMATCRTMLRAAARRYDDPGKVLQTVNETLRIDIPPNMFVTCFYATLDVHSGVIRYANAGHNLPYVRTDTGVEELRATGMPLGLMPGMEYEVKEAKIAPGSSVLIHSDGVCEAHDPDGHMFGFGGLMGVMGAYGRGDRLTEHLMEELSEFTGPDWEQEDDVTLVVLRRLASVQESVMSFDPGETITEFQVKSEVGNERDAANQVLEAVTDVGLSDHRLDQLKTAVAEATMNAIEHGNHLDPAVPVDVSVRRDANALRIRVTDRGSGIDAEHRPAEPDLEAKLDGEQSPRGWGLFLIEHMVDELHETTDDDAHTVELVMFLEGERDASR